MTHTLAVINDITPTGQEQPETCLHDSPFQDIPAFYVKDIQSGEFFELSKLLPKNLATVEDENSLALTLDNSVVRISKKSKTVNSITEIEQWTATFTTYMSILTQRFPRQSQELLQYMSLIRYAARVHKGLGWQKQGWAIYDHKFRQKASRNHTSVWSDVDRQLWLEVALARVAGKCPTQPFPNFQVSPIGLVPKKHSDKFRTICHLSFPKSGTTSINFSIPKEAYSLQYITIDNAIQGILSLGQGCYHLSSVFSQIGYN